MSKPGAPHRPTWSSVSRTLTWLAAVLVTSVLLLPVVSRTPSLASSRDAEAPNRAQASEDGALRTLPLLQEDGPTRTKLGDLDDLTDADTVRSVAQALAEDIGIGAAFEAMWPGLKDAYNRLGESTDDYPYSYPWLGDFEDALTTELLTSHESEVIELAGMLALAAANARTVSAGEVYQGVNMAGEVSQVLLQAAADALGDCDSALSLAWAVNAGESPTSATLQAVFGQAVQRCPGDPTPRWIWGHRLIENAIHSGPRTHDGVGRQEALTTAVTFFEKWMEDEPGSLYAKAGLVDALLYEAQAIASAKAAPFTVRDHAQRAFDLLDEVRTVSNDQVYQVEEAWAAALLGREDAQELAISADEAGTGDAAVTEPQRPCPAPNARLRRVRRRLLPDTGAQSAVSGALERRRTTHGMGGRGHVHSRLHSRRHLRRVRRRFRGLARLHP